LNKRIEKLITYIEENKLDAMYISSYENCRYFSGFTGSNCHLIVTRDRRILITDGRYHEQAREQAKLFELVPQKRSAELSVIEVLEENNIHRVGYETMKMTDWQVLKLKNARAGIEWVPRESFGVFPRMFKDEEEIKNIKKAVEIADVALKELIPCLHIGMTERQAAAELEYLMAKNGSERCAFETISASGPRGALPHGAPTERVIENGDMLTLDFGACYNGYMSDITRTLWFGEPNEKLRRIWDAVFEAQQTAIAAIKPGICAGELDKMHRDVIESYGFGEYIMHSLGHGLGLEIHEDPRVSPGSATILQAGMVITVEPGIYVPGLGGVRTEDTVAVTGSGVEVLTQSPHLIKI